MSDLLTRPVFNSLFEQAIAKGATPLVEGEAVTEQDVRMRLLVCTAEEDGSNPRSLTIINLGLRAVNAHIIRLAEEEPPHLYTAHSRQYDAAAQTPEARYAGILADTALRPLTEEAAVMKHFGFMARDLDSFVPDRRAGISSN